jgi:hypothetical protein
VTTYTHLINTIHGAKIEGLQLTIHWKTGKTSTGFISFHENGEFKLTTREGTIRAGNVASIESLEYPLAAEVRQLRAAA